MSGALAVAIVTFKLLRKALTLPAVSEDSSVQLAGSLV